MHDLTIIRDEDENVLGVLVVADPDVKRAILDSLFRDIQNIEVIHLAVADSHPASDIASRIKAL